MKSMSRAKCEPEETGPSGALVRARLSLSMIPPFRYGLSRACCTLAMLVLGCEATLRIESELGTWSGPPPQSVAPHIEAPKRGQGPVSVRVLHRDAWRGGVNLLGIDEKNMVAVVRMESADPPKLSIESLDLRDGKGSVNSWVATQEYAKKSQAQPFFHPFSETFDLDAARFANVLSTLGPWHGRSSLASPTFAVGRTPREYLFGGAATDGSKGDWLFAKGGTRRIDAGLRASYSPVFAPSGDAVAFVGCQTSPCDYGLYVSSFDEGRPMRVAGIQRASSPQWRRDGSLLSLGVQPRSRCLYRAVMRASQPAGAATALECLDSVDEAAFAQDGESRTAALSGTTGKAGKQSVTVKWVLLEDGGVLAEHTIDRAIGSSVLSNSGILALPMQRGGLAVVDLITGTTQELPAEEGWFFGFDGARFVGDSLILLRKLENREGFDVVMVDTRNLSRQEMPWM